MMETIILHTAALKGMGWGLYQQPQVLILGHFDGIHTGHMRVIRHGFDYGKQHRLPISLMTFHPHPKQLFKNAEYNKLITPLKEKERILSQFGLDRMYIVQFELSFAQLTAKEFAAVICRMNVKHIVVGFDYRFGHGRQGTAQLLKEWGEGCFTVEIVPVYNDEEYNTKVSSTRIREFLSQGDMVNANRLLGRAYVIRGEVVCGCGRGRSLGYPTANVKIEEAYIIPASGVYAVKVLIRGRWIDGVLNIGVKPTFKTNITKLGIEVHLFNFGQNIYGETITVALMSYIRPERKFQSVQKLIAQIAADVKEAHKQLKEMGRTSQLL